MKRQPSSDDLMAFVAEINIRRMPMVLNKRKRRLGGLYSYSERQMELIATARKLHQRYVNGDYHHYDNEWKLLNELGYWLLEEHKLNEHLLSTGKWEPFTATKANALSARPSGIYGRFIWNVRHD